MQINEPKTFSTKGLKNCCKGRRSLRNFRKLPRYSSALKNPLILERPKSKGVFEVAVEGFEPPTRGL